jgi:peptidase E
MAGLIVFNGNIGAETDFIYWMADRIVTSRHRDAAVRDSRRVVLVTAAWEDNEYQEGHLKDALRSVGVPSEWRDGHEVNIVNLGAWHAYREFASREPALWEKWREREALIEETRRLYLERNSFYIEMLRRSLNEVRRRLPHLRLWEILADRNGEFSHPPASFDGDGLMGVFVARDIRETVARLIENDDRMVELLRELDDHFIAGTGLHYNATWQELRERLERTLLGANTVFLFGGNLGALHRCLNFFRLRETFGEAWRRGTSLFASSAGSLLLCDRIIVYNDFPSEFGERREFQLFDRGFGLVRHLQLFPHCMDRIQTDDTDNLSYLAHRFQNRMCVGLNEHSFLQIDTEPELCLTSVGEHDGVYVFDPAGTKLRYDFGRTLQPVG